MFFQTRTRRKIASRTFKELAAILLNRYISESEREISLLRESAL